MKKTFYITTILCLFASVQLMGQCRADTTLGYGNGGIGAQVKLKSRTINAYKSGSNTIIESKLSQTYNSVSTQWTNSYKTDYVYNASNKVIQRVDQNWNTTSNTWVSASKDEYNYLNDNLILNSSFYWNTTTSVWANSSQESYTYNGDNQVTESVLKFWNSSSSMFVNYQRKTFNYNLTTKLNSLSFEEIWNTSTNVWDKKLKTTYTQGFSFKPVRIRIDEWDVASSAYYLNSNNYLKYNADDSLIEDKSYAYFPVSATYDSSFKTIYTYDGNQRLAGKELFKYDAAVSGSDKWVPYNSETFEYATDGRKTAKNTYLQWDGGFKDYKVIGREEYKCLQSSTVIYENKFYENTIIYPNPNNGSFAIKAERNIEEVMVYNAYGTKVFSAAPKENNAQLNLESKGIYFIVIKTNGQVYKEKIIIQ